METGATLATTNVSPAASRLVLDGDAAILGISAGDLNLSRSGTSGTTGEINIAADASLNATGAVILDASTDANFLGTISAPGANVALGGQAVALGAAPGGLGGLVLSDRVLAGLGDAQSLRLRSNDTVDLYGSGLINLDGVTIDARGFRSYLAPGDAFEISVGSARLINSQNTTGAAVPGDGSFTFSAGELDISGGALAFDGFQQININADVLSWSAESSLISPAPTTMNIGVFTPRAGTSLTLDVADQVFYQALTRDFDKMRDLSRQLRVAARSRSPLRSPAAP